MLYFNDTRKQITERKEYEILLLANFCAGCEITGLLIGALNSTFFCFPPFISVPSVSSSLYEACVPMVGTS